MRKALGIDVKRGCRIDPYSFRSNFGGNAMKATLLKRACATALGSVPLLWMGAAYAAHPPKVAGYWTVTANQTVGQLNIIQADSPTLLCKGIGGSIFGSAIEGFYCPVTGRLVFARRTGTFPAHPGIPFQLYEGHVSSDGVVDKIGGSFLIWNDAGGGSPSPNEGVDFNFSATRYQEF